MFGVTDTFLESHPGAPAVAQATLDARALKAIEHANSSELVLLTRQGLRIEPV